MLNLSLLNKNILINKPFKIFEIKNFINKEKFDKLYQTFPDDNYFEKDQNGIRKDSFDSDNEKFFEFLSKNKSWDEFYKSINSEIFISQAYKEALFPNLKSRGLGSFKYWTLNKKKKILKFLYRQVSIKFVFSKIYNSKKIMPHTDATGKLMSMIYYFTDNNWKESYGGDTVFWNTKKKWRNWANKHIKEEDYLKFSKENEILHKSKFEQNKLICFFKNDYSWHSVNEINPQNKLERKVLNIFIRIV